MPIERVWPELELKLSPDRLFAGTHKMLEKSSQSQLSCPQIRILAPLMRPRTTSRADASQSAPLPLDGVD